jgi:hypothetical protein
MEYRANGEEEEKIRNLTNGELWLDLRRRNKWG